MGFGIGGNIPIQEMIWAEYFGRRYLGAVRSLGFPFAMGISAATPAVVALYADLVGNYDGAFFTCACLWAASALLCLLLRLPPKRRSVCSEPSDGESPRRWHRLARSPAPPSRSGLPERRCRGGSARCRTYGSDTSTGGLLEYQRSGSGLAGK